MSDFKTSELRDTSRELQELREQLAASQAREQQLREALSYINHSMNQALLPGNDKHRELILSQSMSAQALALPQDTTALEAMIAKAGEVMRERCAVEAYEWDMAYVLADTAPIGNAEAIRALPVVTLSDLK